MIATELARYIVSERNNSFTSSTLRGAKRCVVDWFATTVPGGVKAPATLLATALGDEVGAGRCELVPGAVTANVRTAALINGAASHTVEFDDIWRDGLYHPGSPVISAALAVSQHQGLSGIDFLRSVIVGYEISNRIAAGINPAHYAYWHTTATVGHHGAAAAACSALGLDVTQSAHALNNVTSFAAGLQQAFRSDSMTKPFHVGQAAANGVLAAMAAGQGVTGASAMLEGEVGLGAAMSDQPDWRGMFKDLGEYYSICDVTQKNHGCCGHTFAALDAALILREQHDIGFDDVAQVRVDSYQAALDICGSRSPKTATEARFSLPYVMAAAMRDGSVRLRAFEPENITDARLLDFASRVDVRVDDALEAAFPKARSASVTMTLKNGDEVSHHCPTRKGDPENPLSDDEINDKFNELVSPELKDNTDALRDVLWSLEELASVIGLVNRFTARAGVGVGA